MLKILTIAASLTFNAQLVDQGQPGRQGPWPVYIQLLPDGGGGSGGGGIIPAYPDGGALCPFAVTYPDGGIVFYVDCDFSLNYSVGPLYPDGGSFPFYVDNAGNIGGGPQLILNSNNTAFAAISAATIVDGGAALPGLDMTAVGSSLDGQFYWTGTGWQTPQWLYVDAGEPVATQGELDAGLQSIKAGGWVTAYDCDYTVQTPQSVSGASGNFTVCGVTGGYGLQFNGHTYGSFLAVLPDAGGLAIKQACTFGDSFGFSGALVPDAGVSQTNARVAFPLDQIVSGLGNNTPIRVTAYFAPFTASADGSGELVQVDNGGNSSNALFGYASGFWGTGGVTKQSVWEAYASNSGARADATSTDQVQQITVSNGLLVPFETFQTSYFDGGWPNDDIFKMRFDNVGAPGAIAPVSQGPTGTSWLFGFECPCVFNGTDQCTLRRLKVEYKN